MDMQLPEPQKCRLMCDNTYLTPEARDLHEQEIHGHAAPKLPDRPELTDPTRYYWGPRRLHVYGTPEAPELYASDPGAFSGTTVRTTPEDLARFAREVLAFLGEDNGLELPPWRPASNGAGKRGWFLVRGSGADSDRIPVPDRYHFSAAGILVRYASPETAQRAADKLNAQERKAEGVS